jgi:methionine synthase II (cobalamin-independent)
VASLRTTVAGSWWPLVEHQAELGRYHNDELAGETANETLRDAAAQAIREQRELGLTEWTGGEYSSFEFVDHLQKRLTGIAIVTPGKPDLFDYDDMATASVVDDVAAPNGLGYVDAFVRESQLPGGVPKATLVGPIELAAPFSGDVDVLKEQLPVLTQIVNSEIRGLAAAGAQHIQLDVPVFTLMIEHGIMTADDAATMVTECFAGVDVPLRGIHICSGNLRGRPIASQLSTQPWLDILLRLDGVIEIAHLALQYFNRYQERELFRALPQRMQLAAGIVDEASYWVESVEKIRARAQAWAEVVGGERLWISPSCGFGRHPARSVPVLRAKMENMVAAAQDI